MAKQVGPFFISGCIQNLQFYKMDGKYYVRRKSSLTAKRLKKDPAFALTMLHAGILGKASKIASAMYKQIPKEEREHSYFRTLTGMAMRLLKKGIATEEVYVKLYKENIAPEPTVTVTEQEPFINIPYANSILNKVFTLPQLKQEAKRYPVLGILPP